MLVFVDESGDTGFKFRRGSSSVFVVSIVIFKENHIAEQLDKRIIRLRHQLGLNNDYEFHFSTSSKKVREEFLCTVSNFEFSYYGIVIQKENLYGEGFKNKESFYKYACKLVFNNAKSELCNATVVFDKTGNKDFNRALSNYLKREFNEDEEVHCLKKIKSYNSKNNNLIQLADMVCGAIHYCYKRKTPREFKYREILKDREAYIQVWPKK